jgi:hypothetical protein
MLPKIRKRQKPCGLWRSQDDFLAQWIKHRLDLPVDESASCPASCIFPPKPGCVSGLPLPRSLSPEPASETLGCPLASVLRLCRRWMLELPRTSHAFDAAGFSRDPSCPGGSCFLLPRLRCRTWVAPRPASPALPAMDHRVAPMLASRRCRAASTRVAPSISLSVSPTIRRPGCPALRILRHRLMDIRVTPDHAPTGLPWLNLRVAPGLLPWLRQLTNFQVALNLGSLTVRRFTAFRVAPNLWFLG